MRTLRWFGFVLLSSATACNCAHRGSTIKSQDSTPDITPNPVDFGNVPVGGSVIQPVTLTDTGSLELDLSSVTLVQPPGGGPPVFSFGPHTNLSTPFGPAVQPGAKANVNLVCEPQAAGTASGSLVIKSNSNAVPIYSVPLTCSGVSVNIVVTPDTVDFGNVQVGTTAGPVTVTFTNQGSSTSDPITLQPVSGTQAAMFSYTGSGIALGPGQSFTIAVSFAPTAQGEADALIDYQYCASCAPAVVSLTGMGVDGQLVYNPDPVSFFSVPAGSSSSVPVSLVNVGTAAVQIGSLALASGTVFALSGLPSLPATLQPDGTLNFTLTYTASAGGNDTDTIDASWVPLDGSGAPVTGIAPRDAQDPVSGNGTLSPCSIQIKPPSLNFGSATVGTAMAKAVTLTNGGQKQCTVSGIMLRPGSDSAFSLVDPSQTGFPLAPGASQTIQVQCLVASNTAPLSRRGALVMQTTDPNQPNVSIPLTTFLQASGPYQNGWPKWHNDNTDQGQSIADTSANDGTLLWQFRVGVPHSAGGLLGSVNPNPSYLNSPVVDEYGNVYQLGMDGTFYAVDPGGNQLWTAKLLPPNPDEHPATPIIAKDDTIYIETGTDGASMSAAQLYHIDAKTGSILYQAGPPTQQSCYSANGCASADGFDVNPSIGNDGLLYDGDDFGQVVTYSLAASGGTFTQANGIILQFYGERVAVSIDQANNSYWCCLNVCFGVTAPSAGFQQMGAWPATGATIGKAAGQGFSFTNSDLAYDQNHTGWLIVEAGSQTGSTGQTEVVAMDPANGSQKWDVTLPSGPTPTALSLMTDVGLFTSDVGNSAPAIATFPGQPNDGVAYVGNLDGMHALDVHTGVEVTGWPLKTPSDVDSAPAIGGDGTIFFGTADGTFYAVNPDGSLRYKYTAGGRISSSPAIGPDGTVFFVADDGNLYAIR